VSLQALRQWLAVGLLLILGCATSKPPTAWSQEPEQITRKVKNKVAPVYPDLARRMNISGVVKVQVMVDKNGNVKSSKLIGGHPILAQSAMDAIRKWRFEAGPEETTGIVEFRFDPTQ
jgi:TonB family protein